MQSTHSHIESFSQNYSNPHDRTLHDIRVRLVELHEYTNSNLDLTEGLQSMFFSKNYALKTFFFLLSVFL